MRLKFLLLLPAICLVFCQSRDQHSQGINLVPLYHLLDSASLIEAIHTDHYQVRRKLDTLLSRLLIAKSTPDTAATDSLQPMLSWLCQVYQIETKLTDKHRLLARRISWSAAESRRKLSLDSTFVATSLARQKKRDQPQEIRDSIFRAKLYQLSSAYREIGDTFSMVTVDYAMSENYFDTGAHDSATAWINRCKATCDLIKDIERIALCELLASKIQTLTDADYFQSEQSLLRASELLERVDNYPTLANVRSSQAFNATLLFQTDKAIDGFHASYAASTRSGNARLQAYCLYGLGEAFFIEGRLDSAAYYSNLAWQRRKALAEKYPELLVDLACTESSLGLIAQARRSFEEASEKYLHADQLLVQCRDEEMLCTNRLRMASLYISQKKYDLARNNYRFILERSTMFENSINAQFGLAVCDYYQNQTEAAVANLRGCIHRQEISRNKLPIPGLTSGMLWDKLAYYQLLACIFVNQHFSSGDTALCDSAFKYVEASKAMALADMLRSGGAPTASEKEQNLVTAISMHENELLVGRGDSLTHLAIILHMEDSLHAERLRAASARRTSDGSMHYSPLNLEAFTHLLKRDSVTVLSYLISDFGCYVFAATGAQISVEKLPTTVAALTTTLISYVDSISQYPVYQFSDSVNRGLAQQLYNALLPNSILQKTRGTHLTIIADGPLRYLPFEALVDNQGKYLVESYEIDYSPSASTFVFLREELVSANNLKSVTVFADPDFGDKSLPALSHSREEAESIASIWGTTHTKLFLGSQATKSVFREQDFRNTRYVHIASHSICNELRPDRSALILATDSINPSSGLLSRDEIASTIMPVDLVFLSVCQSGRGREFPGEGMLSLVQPFLVAKAKSVIATYWNINDRGAVDLVSAFYSELGKGSSIMHALAIAKRDMLLSKRGLFRHPYFWAPFVLIS